MTIAFEADADGVTGHIKLGTTNVINYTASGVTVPGTLTPTGGIVGIAADTAPTAGNVGQVISSGVAIGSAVSLTSTTPANVTSISCTAGDWDISGIICFTGGVTTVVKYFLAGINSTSATLPSAEYRAGIGYPSAGLLALEESASGFVINPNVFRLNATTTIYLVAQAKFTTSTCSAYGVIQARRMR